MGITPHIQSATTGRAGAVASPRRTAMMKRECCYHASDYVRNIIRLMKNEWLINIKLLVLIYQTIKFG